MNINKIIKKDNKKRIWDSDYRVKAIFNEISKIENLKCYFCNGNIENYDTDLKLVCKDMMANIIRIDGKNPNTLICCEKCKNKSYEDEK